MSHEFLDFVEDILDAMDKAEFLVEGFAYPEFEGLSHQLCRGQSFGNHR